MKLYKVIPYEGEPESIVADDWTLMEEQDQYVFLKDGNTVGFFVASSIKSIKEEIDNYDPDAWSKFARRMNVPTTYGVDDSATS